MDKKYNNSEVIWLFTSKYQTITRTFILIFFYNKQSSTDVHITKINCFIIIAVEKWVYWKKCGYQGLFIFQFWKELMWLRKTHVLCTLSEVKTVATTPKFCEKCIRVIFKGCNFTILSMHSLGLKY